MLNSPALITILTCLLCYYVTTAQKPRWTANGASRLWPSPVTVTTGRDVTRLAASFRILGSTSGNCVSAERILLEAATRYEKFIFWAGVPSGGGGTLASLDVCVRTTNIALDLGVDESYSLSVTVNSATLTANTTWGALAGLESFYSLVDYIDTGGLRDYHVSSLPIIIFDRPRFPWRGLMIDTARHFIPVSSILTTVDAMSFSKMNTLHLHLVDAESFPLQVPAYPTLSEKGSFHPSAVYSPQDLRTVVEYGRARGVRVVPEIDIPGHAHAWGYAYPSIVPNCPGFQSNINNVPLNPANTLTFDVLSSVLKSTAAIFTDSTLHLGGDEVTQSCWRNDSSVLRWMQEHGTDTHGVYQTFVTFAEKAVASRIPVHWQEVFEEKLNLPKNAIIQVWKFESARALLKQIVTAGYRALLSGGFYLDKQQPDPARVWYGSEETWKNFFLNDPTAGLNLTGPQEALVLGGEAVMFGECVDSANLDSRLWPRACGVAERLWSPSIGAHVPNREEFNSIGGRLSAHSCRMRRRGVLSGPVVPDTFCLLP